MSASTLPISPGDKVKALRQIQFVLGQSEQPIARACGVREEVFAVLANERLIEVFRIADEGETLDMWLVSKILPEGFALLSQAFVADPSPLQISVVPHPKSVLRKIYEGTRNGLWDLIKVAIGAVLGWWLKKHFP